MQMSKEHNDVTMGPDGHPLKRTATHRCIYCGAHWALVVPGTKDTWNKFWTLISAKCGECCDNAPMGHQIVPLA